jgi:hypothetical protein
MTTKQRIEKTKRAFADLTMSSANELRDDIIAELTDGQMNPSPLVSAQAAWFMRNYMFFPMYVIKELLGYRDIDRLQEALDGVETNTVTPASLDGGFRDRGSVGELMSLANRWYLNEPMNTFMDRISNDEIVAATLYLVSERLGVADKKRKQGGGSRGYRLTPTETPALLILNEIDERISSGEGYDGIAADYVLRTLH